MQTVIAVDINSMALAAATTIMGHFVEPIPGVQLKAKIQVAVRDAMAAYRPGQSSSPPSDDEIVAIARQAIRDGSAMWDHFQKDDAGKFTVPVLDPKDFMLVRAVLAAVKPRAADAPSEPSEPDMLWLSDDPEVYAGGADDFANDYAQNLAPGDEVEIGVDCAVRADSRKMRIKLIDNGDEDNTVEWEWVGIRKSRAAEPSATTSEATDA
jgi:hypothetical protein